MPRATDICPSPRTYTFTASANVTSTNGLKTSFGTSASAVDVLPADLNGAEWDATNSEIKGAMRYVTINRSSAAGKYTTTPIVLYYKDQDGKTTDANGVTLTQSVTPLSADGNDQLAFTIPIDRFVKFAFPAQAATGGAFTIGVKDIAFKPERACRAVRAGAAGNLVVNYDGGRADTLPLEKGERADIVPTKIVDSGTTAYPITVHY